MYFQHLTLCLWRLLDSTILKTDIQSSRTKIEGLNQLLLRQFYKVLKLKISKRKDSPVLKKLVSWSIILLRKKKFENWDPLVLGRKKGNIFFVGDHTNQDCTDREIPTYIKTIINKVHLNLKSHKCGQYDTVVFESTFNLKGPRYLKFQTKRNEGHLFQYYENIKKISRI